MSFFSIRKINFTNSNKLVFLTALIVVIAWFSSLELRGLFIPDEGRYAEIPREMLATGDWITPRQNDLKYFEKPPLQYWMTAASYKLFGEDEWTARLPAALLGFLAVLMVGFTGYRIWGVEAGALAAAILGGSWVFFLASQYLTLDMTLTAFMTFALCSLLLAQSNVSSHSGKWMLMAWASLAFAVLSKGLVGIVLPAVTVVAYVALRREISLLKRMRFLSGGALFLLIAVPWFVMVQQRNPEFFDFFFVQEHFQRFFEPGHNREGAWWYYLPIVLLGLMPWTPMLLKVGLDTFKTGSFNIRKPQVSGFSPVGFCLLWAIIIVLFFSASHSKLPAYVLPAFPAIALLVASRLQTGGLSSIKWAAWGAAALGLLFLGLTPLLPIAKKFTVLGSDAINQMFWFYCADMALIISGVVALWFARKGRFVRSLVILLFGTFGFWYLIFGFLHAIDESVSSERLIETLRQQIRPFRPEVPFYSVEQYDESVPFYLGRTVILVDTIGELGPGINSEPEKVISTVGQFEKNWREQKGQAFAILHPGTFELLRQTGLPMTKVIADQRLVVVSRIVETR